MDSLLVTDIILYQIYSYVFYVVIILRVDFLGMVVNKLPTAYWNTYTYQEYALN